MRAFFAFLLIFIKIFIAVKVTVLLYLTSQQPENNQISDLIWWSSFLIFDMWVLKQLPETQDSGDKSNES